MSRDLPLDRTSLGHVPSPAITDVPGLLVGNAHDAQAITGCTVVLTPEGATAGVDVRGGGPGTRETDLLHPAAAKTPVHGIVLTGGSAFGLAAATGVVKWLREQGKGVEVGGVSRVPIVPAAVIFDLAIGRADRFPDEAMGYAAARGAGSWTPEGSVGVGMGATVGKVQGMRAAMKGGVGTWSETLPDGTVIGALAVCNAFGDVWTEQGAILAGARDLSQGGFVNAMRAMRTQQMLDRYTLRPMEAFGNTTLAVVATSARLDKSDACKLAQMAQTALARVIRPVHTPFDGDTVFALSTGRQAGPHLTILGSVAADVLACALERAVTEATTLGGLPAVRDI